MNDKMIPLILCIISFLIICPECHAIHPKTKEQMLDEVIAKKGQDVINDEINKVVNALLPYWKQMEGFDTVARWDRLHWTCGHGHACKQNYKTTKEEAEKWAKEDLRYCAMQIMNDFSFIQWKRLNLGVQMALVSEACHASFETSKTYNSYSLAKKGKSRMIIDKAMKEGWNTKGMQNRANLTAELLFIN